MKWRPGILVCALIVVGVVILSLINYWREPRYKGRSLSAWLKIYSKAHIDEAGMHESVEAVRRIGTNAIPFLLAGTAYAAPGWTENASDLLHSCPGPWGRWWDGLSRPSRAKLALLGFEILGTNATPAIPGLLRQLENLDHQGDAPAEALAFIGQPAIPVLTNVAIHGKSSYFRSGAIYTLALMGTNACESVDVLLAATRDADDVRISAVWALSQVSIDPAMAFPALTNALCSTSDNVRAMAVVSLFKLRGTPSAKIPALMTRLTDPDARVRNFTTNVLRSIAPDQFGAPDPNFRVGFK